MSSIVSSIMSALPKFPASAHIKPAISRERYNAAATLLFGSIESHPVSFKLEFKGLDFFTVYFVLDGIEKERGRKDGFDTFNSISFDNILYFSSVKVSAFLNREETSIYLFLACTSASALETDSVMVDLDLVLSFLFDSIFLILPLYCFISSFFSEILLLRCSILFSRFLIF